MLKLTSYSLVRIFASRVPCFDLLLASRLCKLLGAFPEPLGPFGSHEPMNIRNVGKDTRCSESAQISWTVFGTRTPSPGKLAECLSAIRRSC